MSTSRRRGRLWTRAAARPVARVCTLVVAAVALLTAPAGALETQHFGLEPYPLFEGNDARRSFEVAVKPGGTATDSVRVWNKTNRPLTLRLYGAGVTVREGQYEIAPFESRSQGTGSWVTPERQEIRLEPKEDAVVPFTVDVPPVLGPGPRMAAVVAESDTGITQGGVEVVARLAMLVQLPEGTSGPLGISWWIWLAVGLVVLATALNAALKRRASGRPLPAAA